MKLPAKLKASSFDAPRPYPAAVLYGPVVLAFGAPGNSVLGKIDLAEPSRSLVPVGDAALTWQLKDDPAVRGRPFYAYREGEPYYVYFDPNDGKDAAHQRIKFHSTWAGGADFHFSNTVGATARYSFEGTGVRWLGSKFDDAGRAEVTIDGKVVAVVDQYGPGRNLPFAWSHKGLPPGRHTIELRILKDKTKQSKDRFINVAGFQAMP